ncbi:MAG: Tat pathway signal sequence domain protein [Asticcacaulis sp.]
MSIFARRLLTLFGLSLALGFITAPVSHAQQGQQGQESDDDKAAEREKKDQEWGEKDLHLKAVHAEGPCPYVKVLYDAARYHEFKDNKENSTAAEWTGEIEGVSSDCAYKGAQPIHVGMNIGFSLGRGPQAVGQTKIYHYWVAVTERDKTVLAKQDFDLPVTFAPGQEAVHVNTQVANIVIPRADVTVSGANFEVLVGFDVTPEMAEFNREGKHFRFVSSTEKKQGE